MALAIVFAASLIVLLAIDRLRDLFECEAKFNVARGAHIGDARAILLVTTVTRSPK